MSAAGPKVPLSFGTCVRTLEIQEELWQANVSCCCFSQIQHISKPHHFIQLLCWVIYADGRADGRADGWIRFFFLCVE